MQLNVSVYVLYVFRKFSEMFGPPEKTKKTKDLIVLVDLTVLVDLIVQVDLTVPLDLKWKLI